MRRFVFGLAIILCAAGLSGAENLVKNGGFEDGLSGWDAQGVRVLDVGTVAPEGRFIAGFDTPTDALKGIAQQALPLEPDMEYTLAYRQQHAFVGTGANFHVVLNEFTPYNLISWEHYWFPGTGQDAPVADKWRTLEVKFFSNQADNVLQFGPITRYDDKIDWGPIWIDDIQITPTGRRATVGTDYDFVVFLPSEGAVGEPVRLHITCLDLPTQAITQRLRKAPWKANETVTLSLREGEADMPEKVTFAREFIKDIPITFKNPGVHRVLLRTADGHEVMSNPIRVTTEAPDLKHYWGDMHIHTMFHHAGFIGGNGWNNYWYCRNMANLDFAALTEHYPASVAKYFMEQMAKYTAEFNEPGRFATILAVETGGSRGHWNYYVRGDNPKHIFDSRDYPGNEYDSLRLMKSMGAEVFTIPHHFMLLYPADWRNADRDAMTLVEIYSNHGSSEIAKQWWRHPKHFGNWYGDSMGAKGHDYLTALARGRKVGVSASSDNHRARPGFEGLTCVITDELNRGNVWDAMHQRNSYATTTARILVDFKINDTPMGQELFLEPGTPLVASVRVNACDTVGRVELIQDGQVVKEGAPGVLDFSEQLVLGVFTGKPTYYYLKVYQVDEHRAWTSPIWVSPKNTPDLVIENKDLDYNYDEGALVVRARNYGDKAANTTVAVFSSAKDAVVGTVEPAGNDFIFHARVEPLNDTQSLLKTVMYIPANKREAFEFSGMIQVENATCRVITDPRGMLMPGDDNTWTWKEQYGWGFNGSQSYSGQLTDLTLLIEGGDKAAVLLEAYHNGSPISIIVGDLLKPNLARTRVQIGGVAKRAKVAEKPVEIPPMGGSVKLQYLGLQPGTTYCVVIDPENKVSELDERNNSEPYSVAAQKRIFNQWPEY